jgi:hypothetical protein
MSNRSPLAHGMSPLRKLLLAVLLAVVLAQIAAMAMVARSQVLKAELRDAVESASRVTELTTSSSGSAAAGLPQAMTVGYAVSR